MLFRSLLNRILIFGAGVLGSLYAARLKQSGQDVTLLARNKRLKDIKQHGIVLEHALTGKTETVSVRVVEHLHENDTYGLIVVLVRMNQLASVLPLLAAHTATPNILFMVNNPSGYVDLQKWRTNAHDVTVNHLNFTPSWQARYLLLQQNQRERGLRTQARYLAIA